MALRVRAMPASRPVKATRLRILDPLLMSPCGDANRRSRNGRWHEVPAAAAAKSEVQGVEELNDVGVEAVERQFVLAVRRNDRRVVQRVKVAVVDQQMVVAQIERVFLDPRRARHVKFVGGADAYGVA